MLPFGLGDLQVRQLVELKPGALFFSGDSVGSQHLAIALRQQKEGYPIWLNLTGPSAFQLRTMDRPYREHVLALNIPEDRLRLRLDQASATSDNRQHHIGRLAFPTEGRACIAAVWPELEAHEYRNTVVIGDWDVDRLESPRFMFDRWSLSVIDEAGEWVDLVKREGATG